MEFQVLGPLQVSRDGAPVAIGNAHKPRLVLAALLSRAGQRASMDWLGTAVWGDHPPASARRNIHLYVHQLRRALGADHIVKQPGGYSIRTGDGGLDAERFEALAAQGAKDLHNGEVEPADGRLRAALDLWHGPAYAEFPECEPLADEAARLDRLRLTVYEQWFEAELALGRAAELTAELADLVRAHPYREGLLAHYMLALYRAGQQAAALETFRLTRATLNEQLGIDPGPELQRLHEAILRGDDGLWATRRAPGPPGPEDLRRSPYQGLTAFQAEHHDWFFGRARLVERLVERVGRVRVVGVFGASGSGKSSLLRAGLLGTISADPAEGWRTMLMTPTQHPLDALADGLAPLTGREPKALREELAADPAALDLAIRTALVEGPAETRLLLIVDQFEEVFTLCGDATERSRFIDALLDAALGERRRTTVVLGVRADFLSHFTSHPGLVEALGDEAQLLVGPPAPAELREIVIGPATRAGLKVDDDLLATVLSDTGTEPGALPLLSHALLETWRRRGGAGLALPDYQAIGGVRGAITKTAERVYEELTPDQRKAARRIFLRLTALGTGTEDTRRPVARTELDGIAGQLDGIAGPDLVTGVLDRLAAARLVVLDEQTVEVAHEALIRAWPRLHRWLTDDRADLAVHRRLTLAAQTWHGLGRDPGTLYRGAPLLAAQTWAEEHPEELNKVETAFLKASQALEEAEHSTVRRRNRLLKRLLAALGALLLLTALGGVIALQQRQEARRQQLIEASHQLALKARSLLATDPDLAGMLAVQAYDGHPDTETRGALLSASAAARRRVELNAGGRTIFKVALSPDGSLLASGGADGKVTLWDPARRTKVAALDDHLAHAGGNPIYARSLAFSADGRLLASTARAPAVGSSPGSLIVWDVGTRRPVLRERISRLSNAMALSQDGTRLAIGLGDGSIQIRDLPTGKSHILARRGKPISSLTFNPNATKLVSASDEDAPVLWDVATGTRRTTIPMTKVHRIGFDAKADLLLTASEGQGIRFWSLDGDRLRLRHEIPKQEPYAWDVSDPAAGRIAVADENGLITIWDIESRRPIETYQDRVRVETLSLALSLDGTKLVSTGFGGSILVRAHAVPAFSGHGGAVNDLDTSPDGQIVASASSDTTVRLWNAQGALRGTLSGHSDHVEAVAFHPGGTLLAAVTRDHTLTIWDVRQGRRLKTLGYQGLGASTDLAFQPGGAGLAVTALGRHRWDVGDPARPVERPFPGAPTVANALAFTPDGRSLITSSPAGGVLSWDLAKDQEQLSIRSGQGALLDLAVSPDGRLIATAGADRAVKLWDARSGKPVATLAGHTAPVQVLAFSRDGRTLASGSQDFTVITWNVATRRPTATLTGHPARVHALTFTADGDLVSGGDDHRIIRWALAPGTARTRICTEVPRSACRP